MENKNILLEREGGSKRTIGIIAIAGGALFILLLVLVNFSFGGDSSSNEENSDAMSMLESKESKAMFDALGGNERNHEAAISSSATESNITESHDSYYTDNGSGLLNILLNEDKQNSNNLVDSVKNDETFVAQAIQGQIADNDFYKNTSSKDKQEQEWWLTKEGFAKPRIIKGTSVGVISVRGGENTQESTSQQTQQTNLNSQYMEQKTLQTLDKMLENASNIDYVALATANAEAQSAAGINNMSGDSTAYRQNTKFEGEVYQPTSAYFSPFNQSLLLPKGTYIPCNLQTRISSELPGSIGCVVANDIYSSNGQTLLIEKGSHIIGSYTNADTTDSSVRLYVIWSEIRTPNNIVIPVDSGGTDPLGGTGLVGERDNHHLTRFGAAILLSIIDGTITSLGNFINATISPNSDIYNSSSQSDLANTALKQTINIKPTIYINQGDLVGVYVNKDIDFSKVYQLRLRNQR